MRSRSVLSRALAHLEAGHLSTEEALRAALKSAAAFGRLVDGASNRNWRRPTVRRIRSVPEAVASAAVNRVSRQVARLKQISSIHWGVRCVRGRRTNEPAVVVHVARKVPPHRLRALKLRRVPPHVSVRHGGRRFRVHVDVQAVKVPARLHTEFLNPGDHGAITASGRNIGSLGAVARTARGAFAITAGHVAALVGATGANCIDDEAGTFPLGGIRRNCFGEGTDIAALGPIANVPDGAVLDATVVRDATSADVHRRVSLRLPGLFTPIDSHVDDVGVTRSFATPAGNITMAGLTAIARVTDGGDSGSAALDERGAIIGFVIGGDNAHTYLLPARRALNALGDLA